MKKRYGITYHKDGSHRMQVKGEDMEDIIRRQDAIDAVKFGITYVKAINTETGEVKELFQASNEELEKAIKRIMQIPSIDIGAGE